MEVKEIEGIRIKPGEKLIIVAPQWWGAVLAKNIGRMLKLEGIDHVILPDGAQLYVHSAPTAGGYQPVDDGSTPTPPGAE